VVFLLAKLVLEKYFRQDGTRITDRPPEHRFDSEVQAWLFPQILQIARRWLRECVIRKDNTFPQMLLLLEFAYNAADRIYQAIVSSTTGQKTLKPILRPYDTVGSTRYVDFDTTRPTYETRPDRCHISHVVADTESWEQKMAQVLEEMEEVICYAKNQNLGFAIPYTIDGEEKNYYPDFLVRVQQGEDPLNLIIEVTGEKKKDKVAKVATARNLWVPAINNRGGYGRWAFLEIADPWDAQNLIRGFLANLQTSGNNS
jgi:type III restriction enzyme